MQLAEAAKPLLLELDNFTRRMTRVRDVFQLASQQGGFPSEDGVRDWKETRTLWGLKREEACLEC